jgi:hypothetical protein
MTEPPPVLGTWGRVYAYALVLANLALCILLLRVFAKAFS